MEQLILVSGWLAASAIALLAIIALRSHRRLVAEQERVIASLSPRRPRRAPLAFVPRPAPARRPEPGALLTRPNRARIEPEAPPEWPICQ